MQFSGKGCESLHNYINAIRISEKLISYVKLDHTFH